MGNISSRVPFDELDPFNGNRVQGYILRTKRRRGDLEVTHVNRKACPQYIYGTPRILHLEADQTLGAFEYAKAFEKLDGTNVLLYRYRDADGKSYVSYKTRLSPFIREQAYGDFLAIWNEILSRYAPQIQTLRASPYAFGFELFGSRVRILTDYQTPLDARLLYALDPTTGRVIEPEANPEWSFPKPEKLAGYAANTSASHIHEDALEQCARAAEKRAVEGAVIYFVNGGVACVYKCKPPAVTERQARYRELYARGKALAKTSRTVEFVLAELDASIEEEWSSELRSEHRSVTQIVREDIAKELEFAARGACEAPNHAQAALRDQTVLWRSLWGSHMWKMAGPASDCDHCIVYQVDTRTLLLGAFEPLLLEPHRTAWRRKSEQGDEHWYELGRAVQLILKGSLTMLYGVMSPIVSDTYGTAHAELRQLLEEQPSRVFYRALLRDVADSERAMQRAEDRAFYLKHLRIACRNLQFGITLFSEGRYAFEPSLVEHARELEQLREQLGHAYRSSRLPNQFAAQPFHDYVLRWRQYRSRLDM